ncbi:hypothetical protein [Mucilaginibacter pedocola]|uniref:Outer membrane protein beta-barrel domain-containing protein n=1 Tax=Mucilaginibacter pedocola TaxID=1792845 RepID=A0A1S9PJ63_9SPHI|nr:hypothetical protein [Mucilaginibacter pedocola]OOQ60618.1 hypothetical protein BC343_23765 [Mucilaginibacter pedocola]
MKTLTILLAFIALSFATFAQKTFPQKTQFSIGIDGGYLTGGLQQTHKIVLGASAQVGFKVAAPLQVLVNAGFLNFFGKTVYYDGLQDAPSYASSTAMQVLPVKAGLRYFLEPNFYLQGDAGVAFLLNRSGVGFNNSNAFIYSPQMGFLLSAGDKNFVDIALQYQGSGKFEESTPASKYGFIGFRVAYGF